MQSQSSKIYLQGLGPRTFEQAKTGDLAALRDEVNTLIKKEGPFYVRTEQGQLILNMAAAGAAGYGQLHVLKYLCEDLKIHPNPRHLTYGSPAFMAKPPTSGYVMRTPLWSAIDLDQDEAALYLLSLPGQPGFLYPDLYLDDPRPETQLTILQELARKGNAAVIMNVVAREADIHAHVEGTPIPLRFALDHGHAEVAATIVDIYNVLGRSAEALETINWIVNGRPLPLLSYIIMLEAPMSAVDKLHIIKRAVEAGGSPIAFHLMELQRVLAATLQKKKIVEWSPLHMAAWMGLLPVLAFFLNQCSVDVNFQTPIMLWSPLHAAVSCQPRSRSEEEMRDAVCFLVERHGADKTLKTNDGRTAADLALAGGYHLVYEYLTTDEREKKQDEAKAAEEALLAELDAEDAKAAKKKESNKKKKEKKKEKAKGKGKGKGGKGGDGKKEEEVGGGVAALAGAMGGLAVEEDDRKMASAPHEGKKEQEQEQEQEEEEEEEVEEDGDEEEFLLAGAPNEYVCPISLTLMTDPVLCGDGHTYERAAIEEWIAKCVTKQQPISSPRTGEEMEGILTANKMARALICDYVDRRRGEWVELQEEKKKLKKEQGQQQQQA